MWRWIILFLLATGCVPADPNELALRAANAQCGIIKLQRKQNLTASENQKLKELKVDYENCMKKASKLSPSHRSQYNLVYNSQAGICR